METVDTSEVSSVTSVMGERNIPERDVIYFKNVFKEKFYNGVPSGLILHGINLKCYRGELTSLIGLGDNSGLEEILELIAGSSKPLEGTISVLEEPMKGLDYNESLIIWEVLKEAKFNRSIIITCKNFDEIEGNADRVIVLEAGVVRCCEDVSDLTFKNGIGYEITIYGNDDFSLRIDKIDELFSKNYPDAIIVNKNYLEHRIVVPNLNGLEMANICKTLEKTPEYNIKSFDISFKGIEEVIKERKESLSEYRGSLSLERFQLNNNFQSIFIAL
ncbi:DgyrCDS13386 [Dimorphilus gyrociliatus]|uniref:DgyrCDS13386 n=1 Tax=Dimorphilus gyrociliatus TaxID=2664684 RepID=A0A7I8WAH3_9ANNE|nr:DgyrCDS13386 [Dimorphilus gyrociliatus]